MGARALDRNASLLLSASVFTKGGEESPYFPALGAPETNHGRALRMDGEKDYHFFANMVWHKLEPHHGSLKLFSGVRRTIAIIGAALSRAPR